MIRRPTMSEQQSANERESGPARVIGLGTIKYFNPKTHRGLIAPWSEKSEKVEAKQEDFYFAAPEEDALPFRVGQLVQFVRPTTPDSITVEEVKILSQKS
jgi:hypothetical protein